MSPVYIAISRPLSCPSFLSLVQNVIDGVRANLGCTPLWEADLMWRRRRRTAREQVYIMIYKKNVQVQRIVTLHHEGKNARSSIVSVKEKIVVISSTMPQGVAEPPNARTHPPQGFTLEGNSPACAGLVLHAANPRTTSFSVLWAKNARLRIERTISTNVTDRARALVREPRKRKGLADVENFFSVNLVPEQRIFRRFWWCSVCRSQRLCAHPQRRGMT